MLGGSGAGAGETRAKNCTSLYAASASRAPNRLPPVAFGRQPRCMETKGAARETASHARPPPLDLSSRLLGGGLRQASTGPLYESQILMTFYCLDRRPGTTLHHHRMSRSGPSALHGRLAAQSSAVHTILPSTARSARKGRKQRCPVTLDRRLENGKGHHNLLSAPSGSMWSGAVPQTATWLGQAILILLRSGQRQQVG